MSTLQRVLAYLFSTSPAVTGPNQKMSTKADLVAAKNAAAAQATATTTALVAAQTAASEAQAADANADVVLAAAVADAPFYLVTDAGIEVYEALAKAPGYTKVTIANGAEVVYPPEPPPEVPAE